MDFLKQLYWGKFSLARTYWLYGVGGWFLFALAVGATSASKWLAYLMLGGRVLYMLFIFGAIWNSAKNYKGSVIWAVLAKLSILLGIVVLFDSTVEIAIKLRGN